MTDPYLDLWRIESNRRRWPKIDTMTLPYRHKGCGRIFDAATVTVLQHYADCSRFACPGCGTVVDERPYSGGLEALK